MNTGSGGSGLIALLPYLLIAVVFFVFVSRSNRRRRASAQAVQSALEPGTRVVTTGGLFATVRSVEDDVLHLEVAPGVQCRYARNAVARVLVDEPEAPADGGLTPEA